MAADDLGGGMSPVASTTFHDSVSSKNDGQYQPEFAFAKPNAKIGFPIRKGEDIPTDI